MKIAIPQQVWDKLGKSAKKELQAAAKESLQQQEHVKCLALGYTQHYSMNEDYEIEVLDSTSYVCINREIQNAVLFKKQKEEITNLKDEVKKYENLKNSIKSIKGAIDESNL